jgi:predicted nuclease with TOPRIM domain
VKGNDGRVRVKLSDSDITALKTGQPTSQPTGQPVEDSNAIKALRDHLNAVREDLARERAERAAERERLNEEVGRARAEVDRIRADMERLTGELDRGRAELADERRHSQELVDKLDAAHRERLRAELARPWWRRLIGR